MSDIDVEVVGSPSIAVEVSPLGSRGPAGADSTVPGPAGPTAVSADAGNAAVLGSDDLIFVPETTGGAANWGDLGGTLSDQTDLQEALDAKANTADLGSAAGEDSSEFATAAQGALAESAIQPADLAAAIEAVVDSAPGALDTLNELAAALGDDANFAGTVTTSLAGKAPISHTHPQSDVTGLATALSGKSDVGHTHSQSDVTGLSTALSGKLDTSAAPELIRDTIGSALVAGTNITITVNDAGDTITIGDTVSPIAAGSANNPHTSASASRNSSLPKNFWQCATTPTNWVDGDEWIQP